MVSRKLVWNRRSCLSARLLTRSGPHSFGVEPSSLCSFSLGSNLWIGNIAGENENCVSFHFPAIRLDKTPRACGAHALSPLAICEHSLILGCLKRALGASRYEKRPPGALVCGLPWCGSFFVQLHSHTHACVVPASRTRGHVALALTSRAVYDHFCAPCTS